MRQTETSKLKHQISILVTKVIHFFGKYQYSSAQTDKNLIDSHLADFHSRESCSGGYNEAFVIQFWASYNPR